MSIFFVRTNGNDSTGDGSTGNPWLTLSKAMTVAVAGDTIKVGTGVYAENTSAAGYWVISKNLASYLTIESETLVAADVTIKGLSDATNNTLFNGTNAFLRFRYLTFGMRNTTAYAVRFNGASSNIDFQNCVIDASANTNAQVGVRMTSSSFALSTISFSNCTITSTGSGTIYDAIAAAISGSGSLSGVTFDTCTITGRNSALNCSGTTSLTLTNCTLAAQSATGILISSGTLALSGGSVSGVSNSINASGGTLTLTNVAISGAGNGITGSGSANIAMTGCAVVPGGAGVALLLTSVGTVSCSGGSLTAAGNNTVRVNGATGLTLANCQIAGSGAVSTCQIGVDGTSGNATAGSITACTITKALDGQLGHALLIGAGCSNFVVDSCLISQAYDYACVIKENAGAIVRYCTLIGGATVAANAALYCKAATGVNAHHNKIVSGANYAVRVLKGDTNNKSGTVTLVDNQIIVRRGAVALDWGDSTNDSGGSVCDRNRYAAHGSFGNVYGTSAVATLAALKTAWATYDVTTNDAKSRRAVRMPNWIAA